MNDSLLLRFLIAKNIEHKRAYERARAKRLREGVSA